MATKEDTPILPQAAAFLVISYLVYRFFFAGSPPSSDDASGSVGRAVDPRRLQQQVEVVRGMFPQFSQAAVEAELIRNGGNIEMATERILSTGFLPEPPQPAAPRPTAESSRLVPPPATSRPRQNTPTGASSTSAISSTMGYTDLIARYNLHHRLHEDVVEERVTRRKGKAPASKQDRMLTHKQRRDEMVLAARKRVEKMIAEGKFN